MYGFFGTISTKSTAEYDLTELHSDAIVRRFNDGRLRLVQATLPKFMRDKIFIETDDALYAIEGIILNSLELSQAYNGATLDTLIPKLYAKYGDKFATCLIGTFTLLIYNKHTSECRLYSDQTGSKILFYHTNNHCVHFAADMKILCAKLRTDGYQLTANIAAIRETFFDLGLSNSKTIISDIHCLRAGECIIIDKDYHVTVKQYHHFHNIPNDNSFSQNIEETDRLFRQAVNRILNKNAEYGYRNIMPLSAGNDSRMTNWVARDLTDAPITNFSYSQSGFREETVPCKIAQALGNDYIFMPLDGGEYVYNAIEDAVRANNGLVYYTGTAQGVFAIRRIADIPNVGCIATGIIGEIMQPRCPRYEGALLRFRKILNINHNADSSMIYYLYRLSFNTYLMGSGTAFQLFTETYSPFQDTDFLQFILTVPVLQRHNYRLYDNWILKKYPKTATWKSNQHIIGHRPHVLAYKHYEIEIKALPKLLIFFILKRLRLMRRGSIETIGNNMNPYDTWFDTNPKIRECYEQILTKNIHHLEPFPDEKQFAIDVIHNGRMTYKARVITVLTALGMFLGED